MFSHIVVGANDAEKSKKFYDACLGALGVPEGGPAGPDRYVYRTDKGTLIVTKPINGEAATGANGGTIGFSCSSPEQVHAWHDAGVAAGGTSCEDPPGLRDMGAMKLYLAYLRDPAGNKLCGVHWMG